MAPADSLIAVAHYDHIRCFTRAAITVDSRMTRPIRSLGCADGLAPKGISTRRSRFTSTTPDERQGAPTQVGGFLKHTASDPSASLGVRAQASSFLRSLPRRSELSPLGSVAEVPLSIAERGVQRLREFPGGAHDGQ